MLSAPTSPVYHALCEALDDEYKARATYAAVIDRFGPVRPFINIIQSEQRHINALQMLLRRRGWPIPDDPHGGCVEAPASLDEACRLGVQAELDNVALYERLHSMAAEDQEVLAVFANLQGASQQRHLPAFRDGCKGGGGGHGGSRFGRCGGQGF